MGRACRTIYGIGKQMRIMLLIIGIVLLVGCESKKSAPIPVPTVSVVQVVEEKIPLYFEYVGNTESPWEVEIRARVEGFLQKQMVPDGTYVKKGQLLFIIDPRPFEAKLAEAKAALAIAVANRDYYKVQATRMTKLVEQGAISREQYDQTVAKYKEGIAQVEQDQANVRTAELNLSYCWMYSPLDGRMGVGLVREGNLVGGTTQTQLANIVQLDPMYVYFSPPAKDLPSIIEYNQKQPLTVLISLPGTGASLNYQGVLDFINNKVTTTTSTISIRAIVKNPQKTLLPGLFVQVKLILDPASNAILIPQKALMEGQDVIYVYVINEQNKVETRNIKIGKVFKTMQVVTSGLKPGEKVMVDSLQQVRPGMTVKPEWVQPEPKSKSL